jgi:hypothetical protein
MQIPIPDDSTYLEKMRKVSIISSEPGECVPRHVQRVIPSSITRPVDILI